LKKAPFLDASVSKRQAENISPAYRAGLLSSLKNSVSTEKKFTPG